MKLPRRSQCLVVAQLVLFWFLELGAGEPSIQTTGSSDILHQKIATPSVILELFKNTGKDKPKEKIQPHLTGVSYVAPHDFKQSTECEGSSGCGSLSLDLNFPPGRPNANNIKNICLYGSKRSTYGPTSLPLTGMSHLRRQGDAINNIEAGFANCCLKQGKLMCAEEVWDSVLKAFCDEEFTIKTKPYHCCKKNNLYKRNKCFEKAAPSPDYSFKTSDLAQEENEDHVVNVNIGGPLCMLNALSGDCIKNIVMRGREPLFPGFNFPPGEPTYSNLKNICKFQKFRPRYRKAFMQNVRPDAIHRKATAINQVENGYRMCCNGTANLTCAKEKWHKALADFCQEEMSIKTSWYTCCLDDPDRRETCFSKAAPYPDYDYEIQTIDLSADINTTHLEILCGHFALLSKQFPISLLVKQIRQNCCHMIDDKKVQCAKNEKEALPAALCKKIDRLEIKSGKLLRKCCSETARETCISERFLRRVTVAFSQKMPEFDY